MSSTIDIEDAVEFVEVREQVMKAKRVISRRFNHVDINNDHDLCISTSNKMWEGAAMVYQDDNGNFVKLYNKVS